jgi:hypothetical protein
MQRENQKVFIGIALLVMLLGVGCVDAITGRMGNAKMILYPEVNGWTNTIIDRTIYTENVNEVAINVSLRLSEGAEDFVELIDENYILQPGESKKAAFRVGIKKVGTYKGKILVFFASTEQGHGPGVVLSSDITVIAKKDQDYQELDDGEDDDESDSDEEDGDETSGITGGAVGVPGTGSSMTVLLSVSTLVLFIVLAGLLYFGNKKGVFKKNGKK